MKRRQRRDICPLEDLAILTSAGDSVAVAKHDIRRGTLVDCNGARLRIPDDVSRGQRFAVRDIPSGRKVVQYGQPFAVSRGIRQGRAVTAVNTVAFRDDDYEAMVEAAFRARAARGRRRSVTADGRSFKGFLRSNGLAGTRNYYLVAPTSLCSSDVAFRIANSAKVARASRKYGNLDGVVAAAHTEGCGCNDGEIIERLLKTIKNTVAHPNVGGALIVDLGCEKTNCKVVSRYLSRGCRVEKPVDYISIQALGGTGRSIAEGEKIVLRRLPEASLARRSDVALSSLVVGTECGASDSFSGITANQLIGRAVDRIINAGGSAILSETPEMMGAERSLIGRMASRRVARKFVEGMNYYKSLAKRLNVSMDGNLVSGNERGGLVNLTLKSLGAVQKGGATEIVDFVDYAERIRRRGLTLMNGPGNDLESMTGMAASGANIILFSTGMGTTEGNLIVPVIKIPTRTETFERIREDMDFNAGALLDGRVLLEDLSERLLDMMVRVASGHKTCSERWQKRSFQIWSAGKLSL